MGLESRHSIDVNRTTASRVIRHAIENGDACQKRRMV